MRTLFALALSAACVAAQAQSYPNRAVRVIVAAQTGGPDIVARVVAAELQAQMGQPFVVENQGGANGIVGATSVAKAAPDGYTLLVYSSGFVINPAMHKSLPYDTEKDFTPVTNLVSNGGLFFAVANNLPPKTLQEFVDYAKKSPNPLAYSTPGVGNTWHLAMEVFNHMNGLKMTHIPYKGGGPATAALASGEVQVMFASPAPLMPHYKGGKVRVLATWGESRHPALPDVPTLKELGYDAQFSQWTGLFVPAGTPEPVIAKLREAARAAIEDPAFKAALAKVETPVQYLDQPQFRAFWDADASKLANVVQRIGKVE